MVIFFFKCRIRNTINYFQFWKIQSISLNGRNIPGFFWSNPFCRTLGEKQNFWERKYTILYIPSKSLDRSEQLESHEFYKSYKTTFFFLLGKYNDNGDGELALITLEMKLLITFTIAREQIKHFLHSGLVDCKWILTVSPTVHKFHLNKGKSIPFLKSILMEGSVSKVIDIIVPNIDHRLPTQYFEWLSIFLSEFARPDKAYLY